MQTFLIHNDYTETAKSLDNKRLNKQALEAWQIMLVNLKLDPQGNFRQPKGWTNHPATRMWSGYEEELHSYIQAMTQEWVRRGYKTTIADKATATLDVAYKHGLVEKNGKPSWMQKIVFEDLKSSHRLALLVKNYDWYSQFNWPEDPGHQPETYEYVWGDAPQVGTQIT
jgi:hypothetical protein